MASNDMPKSAKSYREPAAPCDISAFQTVVRSRRSVRKFTAEAIPDAVVHDCLDLALLAPNSSNLQPWGFYRVKDPTKKQALAAACLGQLAATTAAELIVCVGRSDTWRLRAKEVHAALLLQTEPPAPKRQLDYYAKLVPFAYTVGFASLLAPVKFLLFWVLGLFKPVIRKPLDEADLRQWAATTTALAVENMMLAFRAHGYDSCPMEGFDSWRVRKILKLPCSADILMVIAAGRRADDGIFGPRLRLPRETFIFEV